MERSPIVLHPRRRERLWRVVRGCTDAAERVRYLIVLHSARGWSARRVAEALGCGERTVTRVRHRWRQEGEAGLADRRQDNGCPKVDEAYLRSLHEVLQGRPRDVGHRRPTWTQRVLVETLAHQTGVRVSVATMSRALQQIGARLGRPKPSVGRLGWSRRAKNRRLSMIRQLVATLPDDQAAVWEDEADIDLNPRIGPDWMLPGQQRRVETPGQNVKRYLAGAMDATRGRVTWVRGERKDSGLFIKLLGTLLKRYAGKKLIHVILDNYRIHSSRRVQVWLADQGRRIRLHFLPPYCPDDNRIERCVWRELHQNVTYNHACEDIDELLDEAARFLRCLDRRLQSQGLSQLRKAI